MRAFPFDIIVEVNNKNEWMNEQYKNPFELLELSMMASNTAAEATHSNGK